MKKFVEKWPGIVMLSLIFVACSKNSGEVVEKQFERLPTAISGITFANTLTENDSLNYFTYAYIYMGGGVAAGDIDNDGLVDLFFTGNMVPNKLYLNKGEMKFEDISATAGVSGDNRWYTGVTMADVNGDGWLDIYCSVGGKYGPKENQLFINNRDRTFTEQANNWGVADTGNSVQATFFDYDKDNDLDMFLANYPPTPFNAPNQFYLFKTQFAQPRERDKLYRNDGDSFTEVSSEAGVNSFGLSLSATVGDVNNDSWPDLYISNDFSTPDYFFINNGDGTFTNHLKDITRNTAFYGMGADIADFNNDGYLDLFQVDMTAEDNRRSKANMASMNPDLFWSTVNAGFHYQYMQNGLQLNNGLLNANLPDFSNIARLAGVSSTDWSWGPLFADLDNDGWKDLFISNGTRREINNRDYFLELESRTGPLDSTLARTLAIPSERIDNYVFRNNSKLRFNRVNKAWGMEYKGFSNGVAYADLDGDGDLEIILNNIDDEAVIFKNRNPNNHNYLKIAFQGPEKNTMGLGTRAYVSVDTLEQFQELTLSRGFQSSVPPELHFGLGTLEQVAEVRIQWPDGRIEIKKDVPVNQELVFSYQDSSPDTGEQGPPANTYFNTVPTETSGLVHNHFENYYNDFLDEILLPHQMSRLGPFVASGDIDGDTLEDVVIGGAAGQPIAVYLQHSEGFAKGDDQTFLPDAPLEDMGLALFDAEGDGDLDLYVVSGGNEFEANSPKYQDRLYVNNGSGSFEKAVGALPIIAASGSRVKPYDFDGDGDMDLFIGGRQVPGRYPSPAKSYLLENVSNPGEVVFRDVTEERVPFLLNSGMVTDAVWSDYNSDGLTDLVVVGEWMPLTFLKNTGKAFIHDAEQTDLENSTGWWFSIAQGDFDEDGDLDYVAGNLGLNYKYQANEKETFDIYYNDFDNSGKNDIVLSYFNGGKKYPLRGRECSSQQMPGIKKKFENYASFSVATLEDVYTEKALENALHYSVSSFASVFVENDGGKMKLRPLPVEAQISSIQAMVIKDVNADGHLDVVIGGNLYASEVETPRSDAGIGTVLLGTGDGSFKALLARESGLFIPGDVKDMTSFSGDGREYLIVTKNNDTTQLVQLNPISSSLLALEQPQ